MGVAHCIRGDGDEDSERLAADVAAHDIPHAPVRWGILSAANIGVKAVLPGILGSRNGQLVAIGSRELERAEVVAELVPGARAYGSYDALLDDPDVQAIYIPLPNALHAEWTIRAAEHGKHVLCEKPLGVTADEVRRMFDACRTHGVLLMEAFMYRFHPQIRYVQEQIAEGAIGEVRFVRSAFAFDIRSRPENIRLQAALAGGSLMDVGCYPLSFCRVVFGGVPQAIAARVDVPEGSEVERTVGAVLDFGEGRLGMIDTSFELPWHQFAEVVGERGRIMVPRPYTPGRAEAVVRIERGDETLERRFEAVDQYQVEVEHFADCIHNGITPYLTEQDAIDQAESIEKLYRAAGYRWPR